MKKEKPIQGFDIIYTHLKKPYNLPDRRIYKDIEKIVKKYKLHHLFSEVVINFEEMDKEYLDRKK